MIPRLHRGGEEEVWVVGMTGINLNVIPLSLSAFAVFRWNPESFPRLLLSVSIWTDLKMLVWFIMTRWFLLTFICDMKKNRTSGGEDHVKSWYLWFSLPVLLAVHGGTWARVYIYIKYKRKCIISSDNTASSAKHSISSGYYFCFFFLCFVYDITADRALI